MIDRQELGQYINEIRSGLHVFNDDLAGEAQAIFAGMARDVAPYVWARGVDPSDRAALAEAARHESACAFAWTLDCVGKSLKYWHVLTDLAGSLDALEMAGVEFLADHAHVQLGGDRVAHNLKAMGEHVSAVRAVNAEMELKIRGQNAGRTRANDQRKQSARQRAEMAKEITGGANLLDSARTMTGESLRKMAELYGFDSPDAFQRAARDNLSAIRKLLSRDSKLI